MDALLDRVGEFTLHQAAPWAYRMLAALLVLLAGLWLARLVTGGARRLLLRRIDAAVASFLARLINIALVLVVVIATLDQLGVQTTSLVAILGAAGLAVGLALKDSLGNFAAGVMLIMFRPFRANDYVEAAGVAGTVREVRIFATVLVTPDNRVITVPNGAIINGNIINYSAEPIRRLDLQVQVAYGSDLARVRAILLDILREDARVLGEPAPTVAVNELEENGVVVLVRPWVAGADYWPLRWSLLERIHQRFGEEGIRIPFPQRELHHVREGEASA